MRVSFAGGSKEWSPKVGGTRDKHRARQPRQGGAIVGYVFLSKCSWNVDAVVNCQSRPRCTRSWEYSLTAYWQWLITLPRSVQLVTISFGKCMHPLARINC